MNRIYHQNRKSYDNTIRSAAASRLLSNNPTEWDVRNIVLSLPELTSKEVANFLYQRILDIVKTNHPSKYVQMLLCHDVVSYLVWISNQN